MYEILRGGGFTTGGFNFDTKLRRQSMAATTCSTATSAGSTPWRSRCWWRRRSLEDGAWRPSAMPATPGGAGALGSDILDGKVSLADLEQKVVAGEIDPAPVSGGQERLENLVNRTLWKTV
jgi:xylose isomerase